MAHELTPLPSAAGTALGNQNQLEAALLPASPTAGEAVQLPAMTFSASLGNPCGTASSRRNALP